MCACVCVCVRACARERERESVSAGVPDIDWRDILTPHGESDMSDIYLYIVLCKDLMPPLALLFSQSFHDHPCRALGLFLKIQTENTGYMYKPCFHESWDTF